MPVFDDRAIIEFLRRSYFAVDGLWFLGVESEFSSEDALRIDEKVWDVLPKIQARKAREILKIDGGSLSDLALALWLRFAAEGCVHRVTKRTSHELRIEISECPWYALLKKSGRQDIGPEICERICTRDYAGWAAQFSGDIEFSIEQKISEGAPACEFLFTRPFSEEKASLPDAERKAAG